MRTTNDFLRTGSGRLAILLLAVVVPPAATLIWLGWQLLLQDRALLAQRDSERREAAIEAVVHSLQIAIADADRHVLDGPVPAGMVRLLFGPTGLAAQPADRVAWLPWTSGGALDTDGFAEAERLEFQGDLEDAAATYEHAARTPVTAVRAAALMRLARVRRQQHRWDDALRAYHELARVDEVVIEGAPASLQARRAACAVLADARRTEDLARQATQLEKDFLAGRWAIDRPAWELTIADLERWTGRSLTTPSDRVVFSAVAEAIWSDGSDAKRPVVDAGHRVVTVLYGTRQDGTKVALAISPDVVRLWADRAMAGNAATVRQVNIVAPSGDRLNPERAVHTATTRIAESESALPWTVLVEIETSSSTANDLGHRRRLLSAALAAMLLLLGGGSYFLWRVVRRELAVARLQADFVSAVSHEFRTPLTALRQLAELLQESDDVSPARRASFYEALGRNTERLHRLVESLLDFGRIESGRQRYDFQPLEVAPVVSGVIEDFRREVAARGIAVDLHIGTPPDLRVRADASALANAIWNLLDNAVKYSSANDSVRVSIERRDDRVCISVRDQGLGISEREQHVIFGRFVRGERAIARGITGTGLGLAMVSHIVRAHRGSIELISKEDAGSTFTIVLPTVS